MKVVQCTLAVTFTLFLLSFYFARLNDVPIQQSVELDDRLPHGQINASFPITFYHNAYIDFRFSPTRLRIFTLNACIKKFHYLVADIYYEGVENPVRVKLSGDSLEGKCPSTYGPATPCFYVAHTFFTNLIATGGMQKVIINMGDRKVSLAVKEINKRYESGLTLCLQPVYYYSQWQNIVLYIEAWKAQGASRFIVFYHSGTKETRRVLEYYQSLGILELRSWPSFGELPDEIADKNPKIDDSVFIFSYFLAMNICILDIKTTIGTIADFDEVMVPQNGTLLEYALQEMTGTNVGALKFNNNYVVMEPSIYTSDFSGVSSPIFLDRGGPPKNIFNATVIDLAQVHFIRSFIEPKVTKNAKGALLHHRYGSEPQKTVKRSFKYFPNDAKLHVQNMQETVNTIFNGTIPKFSPILIDALNNCVGKISKKKNTCRSTGGMCKAQMDLLADWVYDTTEGIYLS